VVVAARRTPFATAGRALAGLGVEALAGPVLRALAAEVVDLADLAGPTRVTGLVDDVVLGNCCGPGGAVARVAALAAGLGERVPGVTVDRQCGSGLEAVRLAAALVGSGAADVVLAGGVESASQVGAASGWRAGVAASFPQARFAPAGSPDPQMGRAADALAHTRGVSRERQDAYAARSHERAVAMQDRGGFDAELVPVGGVDRDDRPRRSLSRATLARFRPAFPGAAHPVTVTAGNACGVTDGAAAVAVVSEQARLWSGLPGLRILGSAACGVDPALPGLGPVPAVREVLERTGVGLDQVQVIEIVEAFAAQVLACTDDWGLDPLGRDADRVCAQGGALALGHPWGASGAMLVVRLFSRMVRSPMPPGSYGLACCAVGGGQGLAVLVERVG
jgi:acetyl-CoA C-acetyltransferase